MRSGYNRLNEVLVEGISAVDTYTECLNKFINILEEKTKLNDCQKEVQNIKLQKQSLLTTLLIIKALKAKKLNLLKEFFVEYNQSPDRYVTIKFKLNFIDANRKNISKKISVKLNLKDYHYLKNHNKSINLRLNLNSSNSKRGIGKVINLKIKFKDI